MGESIEKRVFDLEDRLVDFACNCLTICELLPNSKAGNNLEHQLSKSGTAPALNYGEAQAAESPDDFIHKLKLVLKEIRETRVCIKIIRKKPLVVAGIVEATFVEANQLIAIFMKSIETAKRNRDESKKR
jgi:four helix bundle protein